VFIHPGVEIGSDVFVNARSVLVQDIPSGDVVEGFPAKRVTHMQKVKRRMKPQHVDVAVQQILKYFAEVVLLRRMGIAAREEPDHRLGFRYRGREYLILCVPSNGSCHTNGHMDLDKRLIFLVNHSHWEAPSTPIAPMVFDFKTMQTTPSRDPIHTELWRFMRKYFGVTFEYQ
jgi:hypothetical protein